MDGGVFNPTTYLYTTHLHTAGIPRKRCHLRDRARYRPSFVVTSEAIVDGEWRSKACMCRKPCCFAVFYITLVVRYLVSVIPHYIEHNYQWTNRPTSWLVSAIIITMISDHILVGDFVGCSLTAQVRIFRGLFVVGSDMYVNVNLVLLLDAPSNNSSSKMLLIDTARTM